MVRYVGVNKWHNSLWECRCSCGGTKVVPANRLSGGRTRSCGCLTRYKTADRKVREIQKEIFGFRDVPGVVWKKSHSVWLVRIKIHGESIFIGHFKSHRSAVKARHDAEKLYLGEGVQCHETNRGTERFVY